MIHLLDDISISVNVAVALRDKNRAPLTNKELTGLLREGNVPVGCPEVRVQHNVLVNNGRTWLRNHILASSFPGASSDQDLGSLYGILPTPGAPTKTYRVRWIAVGIGGALQTTTPPGVGSFIEERSVTGLENPYSVSGTGVATEWMKQVLPVGSLTDLDLLPDSTTARFRGIFAIGEIAYPGSTDKDSVSYGTDVPISEAGLFTSQATYDSAPTGGVSTVADGLIAYNIFRTISVTPNFELEIAWDLRF